MSASLPLPFSPAFSDAFAAAPPTTPTLADLRERVGATTTKDDALLTRYLATAVSWVDARIYPGTDRMERDEAVLLLASRLYKRRQSPEGVAGWSDMGVVRIVASDPDLAAMMERLLDLSSNSDTGVGIA